MPKPSSGKPGDGAGAGSSSARNKKTAQKSGKKRSSATSDVMDKDTVTSSSDDQNTAELTFEPDESDISEVEEIAKPPPKKKGAYQRVYQTIRVATHFLGTISCL